MLAIMALIECSDSNLTPGGDRECYPPYEIKRTTAVEHFSLPADLRGAVDTLGDLQVIVYWSPDSGLLSFPAKASKPQNTLTNRYEWLQQREDLAAYLAHEWVSWIKAKQHTDDPATEKEAALFEGKQGAD